MGDCCTGGDFNVRSRAKAKQKATEKVIKSRGACRFSTVYTGMILTESHFTLCSLGTALSMDLLPQDGVGGSNRVMTSGAGDYGLDPQLSCFFVCFFLTTKTR